MPSLGTGERVALEIGTHEARGVPLFALDGELDIYTVPRFQHAIEQLPHDAEQIILDLRMVSLVDSSGLGALLRLVRHGADRRQVALVCEGPTVPRLLELTKLADQFLVVANVAAAHRAFDARADGSTPSP